jgi:hypothetical protein
MKKFLSFAFAMTALVLFVGQAPAAKQVVKAKAVTRQVGNRTVTKTKTVTRNVGANKVAAANVNVNVNAGHAVAVKAVNVHRNNVNVVAVNRVHNNVVAVNHVHHNNVVAVNRNYGYNYHNVATVVQPVQVAVAYTQPVATLPVTLVNAPAVATSYTATTVAPTTTCTTASVGVVNAYAAQKVIQTQVIKQVNVPVGIVGY